MYESINHFGQLGMYSMLRRKVSLKRGCAIIRTLTMFCENIAVLDKTPSSETLCRGIVAALKQTRQTVSKNK